MPVGISIKRNIYLVDNLNHLSYQNYEFDKDDLDGFLVILCSLIKALTILLSLTRNYLFIRFSTRSLTTAGSANVDVSPKLL